MNNLLQLFPQPCRERPLAGAYLAHDLRQIACQQRQAFVYANFVTSLDGRIAVARSDGGGLAVPGATANDRDWRLFQELATQADLIISSGRYTLLMKILRKFPLKTFCFGKPAREHLETQYTHHV